MRIIAVANQKGGCGKTTIVINLGACLAREGQRVLAVDLDPQGHCALGLAVPEEQIEQSVSDVLMAVHQDREIDFTRVTWQISSNFDLVPAKFDLSKLEQGLAGVTSRETLLRGALQGAAGKYDIVLVDTPPTVGLLTENALNAADEVIVPVDTGYFSLQGLSKQLDTIRMLRAGNHHALQVRILANLYDVRTKLGREILAELRKRHGDAMYTSFVNFNTKLKESTSLGQPITEYDPSSSGCRDFVRLARELISIGGGPTAPAVSQSLLAHADALAENASKLLATSQTLLGAGRMMPPAQAPVEPASPPITPALGAKSTAAAISPEETARKIEAIYGAHALSDGVAFTIKAAGAVNVRLAGDFNDWQPERTMLHRMDDGLFHVKLPLSRGRYRYRYVIDGQWRNDPHNGHVETNPYGDLNSVVEVG